MNKAVNDTMSLLLAYIVTVLWSYPPTQEVSQKFYE